MTLDVKTLISAMIESVSCSCPGLPVYFVGVKLYWLGQVLKGKYITQSLLQDVCCHCKTKLSYYSQSLGKCEKRWFWAEVPVVYCAPLLWGWTVYLLIVKEWAPVWCPVMSHISPLIGGHSTVPASDWSRARCAQCRRVVTFLHWLGHGAARPDSSSLSTEQAVLLLRDLAAGWHWSSKYLQTTTAHPIGNWQETIVKQNSRSTLKNYCTMLGDSYFPPNILVWQRQLKLIYVFWRFDKSWYIAVYSYFIFS